MNKAGPIIIIDDDEEDQELIRDILSPSVKNELCFFSEGSEALEYLNQLDVCPFLILSDINMPKLNGFELRKMVFENKLIAMKCIPYLFFTTASTRQSVIDAYTASAQGFFQKPTSMEQLSTILNAIVTYWSYCLSPNSFNDKI